MAHNLLSIILFGPGIRYVPDVVWRSKFFWIALVVMIVGILIYHNYTLKRNGSRSLLSKRFGFLGGKNSSGAPKIAYSSDGRSGHVHYQSAEADFEMYYEFSGGDCVASINIPSPEEWEKITKLPLDRRDEVLDFIGHQVVKDQTTDGKGYFKIEGNWLNIYA